MTLVYLRWRWTEATCWSTDTEWSWSESTLCSYLGRSELRRWASSRAPWVSADSVSPHVMKMKAAVVMKTNVSCFQSPVSPAAGVTSLDSGANVRYRLILTLPPSVVIFHLLEAQMIVRCFGNNQLKILFISENNGQVFFISMSFNIFCLFLLQLMSSSSGDLVSFTVAWWSMLLVMWYKHHLFSFSLLCSLFISFLNWASL